MSSAFAGSTPHPAGSKILLETARPDLYQRNAFRVTELPVDATAHDFSRRQQMVDMATKTGLAVPAGPSPIFPLEQRDGVQAVRDAMHRLRDPELRLVDEFFWFWPHQLGASRTDDALAALARVDYDQAVGIWHDREDNSSESHVSTHNMAVLRHFMALEWELAAQSRTVGPDVMEQVTVSWVSAFRRWRMLLEHEGFWSRLSARIRDLDDPRLTTGTARRIRTSLPLALLSINARLAVQAAERGDQEAVQRQLRILKVWEQPDPSKPPLISLSPLATQALQHAAEPIRERIKLLCKTAEAEAEKDPAHADEVTRHLLQQTCPLLALLDCLFGQMGETGIASTGQAPLKLRDQNPATDNPFWDGARDEVAQRALACQVRFGNTTENWRVSKQLLDMVLPIAASESLRQRIQENIKIVEGNVQSAACWFCGMNPADKSSALEVKMYGDVQRIPIYNGARVTWKSIAPSVPRCAICKEAQSKEGNAQGVGGVAGGLVGLGGCATVGGGWGGFAVLVIGLLAGAGIGAAVGAAGRPKHIKPESAKIDYPAIKELMQQGWQCGEQPAS